MQIENPCDFLKGEKPMPIEGIAQPEILPVSPTLCLKRFCPEEDCAFALPWYQDESIIKLVEGPEATVYDSMERLLRMYHYLNQHGELYWIEELQGGAFVPIGDVTLEREDMPIVIGPAGCRGRGIGRAVIGALVNRAKSLGWDHAAVHEIYHYNTASRRMFLICGFYECGETEDGKSYRLDFPSPTRTA